MKTNLHFTIESKEITKQILETVAAEVIHNARQTVDKSFDNAIKTRFDTILKNIDKDLQKGYWNESQLKKLVIETIQNSIKDYINNDNDLRQQIIANANAQMCNFERECYNALQKFSTDIDKRIDKKFDDLINNQILKSIFNAIKEGGANGKE